MTENIQYIFGDATRPIGRGPIIIPHICNDIGAWGRGFVLSLSKRWPHVEQAYRRWYQGHANKPFALGEVDFVEADDTITVANMIAQHGLRSITNPEPIQYGSLKLCLAEVRRFARECGAMVHMPRIGSDLAGGDWKKIEANIYSELCNKGISVYVYTLR